MKKCFAFDPLDRNLEIEAYGEKFNIVANSAKNQQIIKETAGVLGSDKGAFDKVSAVCSAVDGILGAGVSDKIFGVPENACYDEIMAFYNFLVNAMVEHSVKTQEKYSPNRAEKSSKN